MRPPPLEIFIRCFGGGLGWLGSDAAPPLPPSLARSSPGRTHRPCRGAMGEIPKLVKISVSLRIQPNDGPVYFKVDGQRFDQSRTIKLLTGAKYTVEVVLKPGVVHATTMGIGGVNIPLEEKSRDPQVVCYTGIYDTEGVPHTKSGQRQPLQVNIQFSDIGTFETVWQVKFYDYHKRNHCQWGNAFGSIEYECKPNETRSLMWINKEMFH
ncbi:CB1 cannabinoid receptor-interacting protein 1 isoform X2 [Dermochelys coriacea]|uniref:CB1 cannabinoid receptor-interacting protein 1 isoform X2 n=1 Tax=Dermochelys coriacea TaxID=27794 RepID=UPI0018E7029B|nr:CB1 cannabinoid receptor-interacting protein 1 isoform X2 [Dermochelys coriacea]